VLENPVSSTCGLETLLATVVVESYSTPPSTTLVTPAKLVACRRRQSKQRDNRKHVTTRRSIDWKLVDSVFEPLHARFDFTLEGFAHDEGLYSHSDLPQCSLSDFVMERDLSGERVFINPPCELVEEIGRHF
jgi:hypothetical protein